MTSGGSCRSPSITATHTPRAKLSPAKIAAWCPALVTDLVADGIGHRGDVLELCCGDLALYQHLARRGLAGSYLGLEQSCAMLRLARRRGVDVRAFDVRAGGVLPTAAAVIMQASLYQF